MKQPFLNLIILENRHLLSESSTTPIEDLPPILPINEMITLVGLGLLSVIAIHQVSQHLQPLFTPPIIQP